MSEIRIDTYIPGVEDVGHLIGSIERDILALVEFGPVLVSVNLADYHDERSPQDPA